MKLLRTATVVLASAIGLSAMAAPASAGGRAPVPQPTKPTSVLVISNPTRATEHSCYPGQTCPSDDHDDRVDNIVSCLFNGGWPEDGEDGSISCDP